MPFIPIRHEDTIIFVRSEEIISVYTYSTIIDKTNDIIKTNVVELKTGNKFVTSSTPKWIIKLIEEAERKI